MSFVLCCLETAVAWGTHSGHLKPYWQIPTVVNEKRTRVLRVSLVSIIFIRFPDALLETKQLTSFPPLVVSGLAGVWPTCFPSGRLYGDTGYKVLIPQTKPSWKRSFQVSWHMLVMTPWHCGRENGDWWTKQTWTLLLLVRSPNICKATIWRTAPPGSFVSGDWWMNFKITWMC